MAQPVERVGGEQLGVDQPGCFEPLAVGAVERGDLARVNRARPLRRPALQRGREPSRFDTAAFELGEQAYRGAGEPRSRGRCRERDQVRAADGLAGDQFDLQPRSAPRRVATALRDLLEQPGEANHAATEQRALAGQLALVVVDVVHTRDDEQRLLVEPSPESAQHRACLGGISRTGYER